MIKNLVSCRDVKKAMSQAAAKKRAGQNEFFQFNAACMTITTEYKHS
jgi:hypothetical protein